MAFRWQMLQANRGSRAGIGGPWVCREFQCLIPTILWHWFDAIGYMDTVLSDYHSGTETAGSRYCRNRSGQGGGVISVAPIDWGRLRKLCDRYGHTAISTISTVCVIVKGQFFPLSMAGITLNRYALSRPSADMDTPISLILRTGTRCMENRASTWGNFRGNQLHSSGRRSLDTTSGTIEVEVKRKEESFEPSSPVITSMDSD